MTADRFPALARSSPWRWSSVEFTLDWTLSQRPRATLHVWIRRPDALRVESGDEQVLFAGRAGSSSGRALAVSTLDDGASDAVEPPLDRPEFDADGLVARRPWNSTADDPFYENYYFVALLDPLELADGEEGAPGTELSDVRRVEHRGRAAWEATVRPTAAYVPRCACCALLPCQRSDQLAGFGPRDDDRSFTHPDEFVVRLDEQTGICVYIDAVGGTRAGVQHDVGILAVDDDPAPELFDPPTIAPRRSVRRRPPG